MRQDARKALKGLVRQGILASDFDLEAELERLEAESRAKTSHEIFAAYATQGPKPGTSWASAVQVAALKNFVRRWIETHDTSFMDLALQYCHEQALPILPALLKHLVDASKTRTDKRTPRAIREGVKGKAFEIIANLVILGGTLTRASGIAAIWTQETPHPHRASTLESQYVKVWRSGNPSSETILRNEWKKFPEPEFEAEWKRLLKVTREPTQDEKGDRR